MYKWSQKTIAAVMRIKAAIPSHSDINGNNNLFKYADKSQKGYIQK
jgi:hypothetical protein